MKTSEQLDYQVFNLEKNGYHDYSVIKTIVDNRRKKTRRFAELIMLKEVNDANELVKRVTDSVGDNEREVNYLVRVMRDASKVLRKVDGFKDLAHSYTDFLRPTTNDYICGGCGDYVSKVTWNEELERDECKNCV